MLVGLSAVLLSVCGLFISIYETSLIRQEQRASVWPHVQVGPSFRADTVVAFHVGNTGIGPARVRAAAVQYDGETKATWNDFLQDFAQDTGLSDSIEGDVDLEIYRDLINGRVLPTDLRMNHIFRLTAVEGDSAGRKVVEELQRVVGEGKVEIALCYCSVYEECWTTSMQDRRDRFARGDGPKVEQAGAAPRSSRPVESCDGRENSRI